MHSVQPTHIALTWLAAQRTTAMRACNPSTYGFNACVSALPIHAPLPHSGLATPRSVRASYRLGGLLPPAVVSPEVEVARAAAAVARAEGQPLMQVGGLGGANRRAAINIDRGEGRGGEGRGCGVAGSMVVVGGDGGGAGRGKAPAAGAG